MITYSSLFFSIDSRMQIALPGLLLPHKMDPSQTTQAKLYFRTSLARTTSYGSWCLRTINPSEKCVDARRPNPTWTGLLMKTGICWLTYVIDLFQLIFYFICDVIYSRGTMRLCRLPCNYGRFCITFYLRLQQILHYYGKYRWEKRKGLQRWLFPRWNIVISRLESFKHPRIGMASNFV